MVNLKHYNLCIGILDSKYRFIIKSALVRTFGSGNFRSDFQGYFYMSKGLPDLNKDFSGWYTQVVNRAGLADYGPVKGTMVIKPYGFQLWEHIKEIFDGTTCEDYSELGKWAVMRKEAAGFDSLHGNWIWQELLSDRSVLTDSKMNCIGCHRRDECVSRDYMCTVQE